MRRSLAFTMILAAPGLPAILAQEKIAIHGDTEPNHVERLLDALDVEQPALADVREAAINRDWSGACQVLAGYYRKIENPAFRPTGKKPERDDAAIARAEAVLDDTFTFYE